MIDIPQTRYDKANRIKVQLNLNKKTDADVLAWLDRQENRQGAVKALIRPEIAKENS